MLVPKHQCVECGFLASVTDEVVGAERCMLASQGQSASMPSEEFIGNLCCRRSLWVDHDLLGAPVLTQVNDRRQCKGFAVYQPGRSPDQHMEDLLKSKDRWASLRQALLIAVLGGIIALAGQLLIKHLGADPQSPHTTAQKGTEKSLSPATK